MDKTKISSEFEIAPLRTLSDFILEEARFQIPNVRNLEKWGNRVVNNLLYYQTNYFVMAAIMFTLVGVLHPGKMACGLLSMVIVFSIVAYLFSNENAYFKKKYPLLSIGLIMGGGYFVLYALDSMLVFLFGILLPFCATFLHASLRLRNIKNKIVNRMENIGLKRTPMSLFLDGVGIEQDIFS